LFRTQLLQNKALVAMNSLQQSCLASAQTLHSAVLALQMRESTGLAEGLAEGLVVGASVGVAEGAAEGSAEGTIVLVGNTDGAADGAFVS
jgi:hypothetical protein